MKANALFHSAFLRRRLGSAVFFRALLLVMIFNGINSEAANWSKFALEASGVSETGKEAAYVAEDSARIIKSGDAVSEAAIREARHLSGQTGGRVALREVLAASLRSEGADASAIRFIDGLAEADLETAAVLMRGGRRMREVVPDVLTRSRLARQGGTPVLTALGLADSIPVEDFLKLDALVAAGKVPVEVAGKPALARLGELLSEGTERSSKFYQRYIRGNEGKWAAGGALVWWMEDPDSFQDAAGHLTEAGFKKLTELGGAILASSLRGIGEGSQDAAKQVATAMADGYLKGRYAWAGWCGLVIFICLIGLAVPLTRGIFLKLFRNSSRIRK